MKTISVVFTSRGRPVDLVRTTDELKERAHRPDAIEIIVAVDPDDDATLKATLPWWLELWVAPERYGYTGLHRYLNHLAVMASGTWLQWWNDDMRMLTEHWDDVVTEHRPAILWPYANHVEHANIVPAWPKAWSDAMGHVSPTSHMDTYLQYLGGALDRHDRVEIRVLHDRADVTGNHDDQTYAEGRKLLGPEGMVPGFDMTAVGAQLAIDAELIRKLL